MLWSVQAWEKMTHIQEHGEWCHWHISHLWKIVRGMWHWEDAWKVGLVGNINEWLRRESLGSLDGNINDITADVIKDRYRRKWVGGRE